MVLQFSKMRDDSSFELKTVPSDKNNNLSVFMKAGETKDSAWVIGESTAQIPISKIDEVITSLEKQVVFDKMIDKYNLIKSIAPGFDLIYRVNKGNFMMAARDYILSTGKHVLSSGEIIHTFFTTSHPDHPEQDKITRTPYLNGIWILTPVDESNTKITKITECDLTMKPACGPHVQNLIKELLKAQ